MKLAIDHVVVAARTLDEGVAWCKAQLGITPGPGGKHAFMGTHNRLFSIQSVQFPRAYFEIIAIDRSAPAPRRPRWFDLDQPALHAELLSGRNSCIGWRAPRTSHWRWPKQVQPGSIAERSFRPSATPIAVLELAHHGAPRRSTLGARCDANLDRVGRDASGGRDAPQWRDAARDGVERLPNGDRRWPARRRARLAASGQRCGGGPARRGAYRTDAVDATRPGAAGILGC